MRQATVFAAYPSRPPDVRETIELALKGLDSRPDIKLVPWPEVAPGGTLVIHQILDAIDRSVCVLCDVTDMNANVLFELGYAVGREKVIWLSINGVDPAQLTRYARFPLLRPISYRTYQNHQQFIDHAVHDLPWNNGSPIHSGPSTARPRRITPTLFYIKSPSPTDASVWLTETLQATPLFQRHFTDDPAEAPQDDLLAYLSQIERAAALVAHLLPDNHPTSSTHNARCAFMAGVAHGKDKPILLLAPMPFHSPFDYQHLLRVHSTAQACRNYAEHWLEELQATHQHTWQPAIIPTADSGSKTLLRQLHVGETTAENEVRELSSYFVDTAAFRHLLSGSRTIFVGRKGTGKTANLYAARHQLLTDPRNHVCVIKPVTYEAQGIVRQVATIPDEAERGFLLESLWKLIIYSELATSVITDITAHPIHWERTQRETDLVNWGNSHANIIYTDVEHRVRNALDEVAEASSGGQTLTRLRISELLHERLLKDIRQLLGHVLTHKNKVMILIDNLDHNWRPTTEIALTAQMLLSLIEVSNDIVREFQTPRYQSPAINLSLGIFLRADVFSQIRRHAKEPDKLHVERIAWSDTELLLRIINQRLTHSLGGTKSVDQVWSEAFVARIGTEPTRDYLVRSSLPRPRDLIALVRSAINTAVDRGHPRVEEEDALTAIAEYSYNALFSLIAEDDPEFGRLEDVLYAFAGRPAELSFRDITDTLISADVAPTDISRYIDLLCDLSFLGIRTKSGLFVYPESEEERRLLRASLDTRIRSRTPRRSSRRGKGRSIERSRYVAFRINDVFHQALDTASANG